MINYKKHVGNIMNVYTAAPMGYPLYKKLGFEDACNRCKEMEYHWE